MKHLKLIQRVKDKEPKTYDAIYGSIVEEKIRERYSLREEIAIIRQRDTKPEEFKAYNDYVEQCKIEAKQELEVNN